MRRTAQCQRREDRHLRPRSGRHGWRCRRSSGIPQRRQCGPVVQIGALAGNRMCLHSSSTPVRYRDRVFQEIQTLAVGVWFDVLAHDPSATTCRHDPGRGWRKDGTRSSPPAARWPSTFIIDLHETTLNEDKRFIRGDLPKKPKKIRNSQGDRACLPTMPAESRASARTRADLAANMASLVPRPVYAISEILSAAVRERASG